MLLLTTTFFFFFIKKIILFEIPVRRKMLSVSAANNYFDFDNPALRTDIRVLPAII